MPQTPPPTPTPTGAAHRQVLQVQALSWLSAIFSSRSWLSLFTLLVFAGLFSGLIKLTVNQTANDKESRPAPSQTGQPAVTRSFGSAIQNASCGQILATFSSTATLQQIARLLSNLNTVISYGPNENGAFELRTSTALAVDVARALETSPIVTLAAVQPQCP